MDILWLLTASLLSYVVMRRKLEKVSPTKPLLAGLASWFVYRVISGSILAGDGPLSDAYLYGTLFGAAVLALILLIWSWANRRRAAG
ncbi:MAG: hypothetical protein Q8R28_04120 [Dehalococcoidia bacterium]|nr:hypothetical protein [Dehalococcoidia bacterium]